MHKLLKIVFPLYITAFLFITGLGIGAETNLSFYLLLMGPPLLFISSYFTGSRRVYIPGKLTLWFIIFIVFSAISTIRAVEVQRSFEQLIRYVALYILFIYILNHRDEIESWIISLLFMLGALFSVYSLFTDFFLRNNWLFLIPKTSFNVVFPTYFSHNHLGDFLMILFLICFWWLVRNKNRMFSLVFMALLLPFFLLSYSRSAYLALLAGIGIMGYAKRKTVRLHSVFFNVLLIIGCTVLFTNLISVNEAGALKPLKPLRLFLVEHTWLQSKPLVGDHVLYLKQAFQTMQKHPLLGIGPNNFIYASRQLAGYSSDWSSSSHNVIIDLMVENGLLAWIALMTAGFYFVKNRKKSIFLLLLVSLFVNFQTDYTSKIPFFLVLLVLFAGLSHKREKEETDHIRIIIVSGILFLFFIAIFLSNFFYARSQYVASWLAYPLNKKTYPKLMDAFVSKKEYAKALFYADWSMRLFRADRQTEYHAIITYFNLGEMNKLNSAYKQMQLWNPKNANLKPTIKSPGNSN